MPTPLPPLFPEPSAVEREKLAVLAELADDEMQREMLAIIGALSRARFRYANEIELHDGITALIKSLGIPIGAEHREVRLSDRDRIDFLLASAIGIEVKVNGSPGDVWRQLARYAEHDRVRSLLLITTRLKHVRGAPTELGGKQVGMAVLRGGLR